MSEFYVEVVRLDSIEPHPNADRLFMSKIKGYTVIFNDECNYKVGDKVVFIPEDAVVPADDSRWDYLGDNKRVKAKRLRGIFSMGIITPADPSWEVGQNVQEQLKIERYTPPEPVVIGGENERDPGFLPVYTDIESLRRYEGVLLEDERVVITEKVDGANGRWLYEDGRLWAGSHTCIKSSESNTIWWRMAKQHDLETKLKVHPGIALYGEVYGHVQKLKYETKQGEVRLLIFDAMDIKTRKYLDYDALVSLCKELDLPMAPEIYRGPWKTDLTKLAEDNSSLASHMREGIIIRPEKERFDDRTGRVILKYVGERYLLKKD